MNFFASKARHIINTGTVKDTGIVFVGQIISTIFSAIFFFIIARKLGPANLGIYSTSAAVVMVLTDTIDIAINSSIIKFSNSDRKDAFLKFALLLKIGIGIFLMLLLFTLSNFFSILLKQNITVPLRFAAVLLLVTFVVRFPKSYFQAHKKFSWNAQIDIGMSFLRLILALSLIALNILSVISVINIQIAEILIVCLFFMRKIPLTFLRTPVDNRTRRDFFSFHGWLSVAFILAAIHSRLDTFFLMRFSGPGMVGYYQAGYRFYMPVVTFAAVLSTVFAPRFSSFPTTIMAKKYLKKGMLLASLFAFFVFSLIIFLPLAVKIFFGPAYQNSILPAQLLAPGYFSFVIGVPIISYLIYHRCATKFFIFLNLLQLILIVFFDILLIPKYQAVGAAAASSITLTVVNLIAAIWALRK